MGAQQHQAAILAPATVLGSSQKVQIFSRAVDYPDVKFHVVAYLSIYALQNMLHLKRDRSKMIEETKSGQMQVYQ